MPEPTPPPPHFSEAQGSYYYLSNDFRSWRARFENLVSQHQLTDLVAKQFAFVCMRDLATQAVMDISLYGPETLSQMLNTYQDRFCLVQDLERLRTQRGGNLHGPWHRRRARRRRSLLRPYPKRGIRMPTLTPPMEGGVRIITDGAQLAEIVLPPDAKDTVARRVARRTKMKAAVTGDLPVQLEESSISRREMSSEGPRDFQSGQ